MWPKPDSSKGINGDGSNKGETVKLSRDGGASPLPQQNGVSKNGDADRLLGSVRSGGGGGDGETDSGEWMRRAVYQVQIVYVHEIKDSARDHS